jgi:hypothetical protein
VRSLHSASAVPLQLQPSHSCNEETNEQIDNISCVTLTYRSPSWGWFVVTQNVPVYMFEAPAHLTNIRKFTAHRKFRVWTKCGHLIDVRAGDMCIETTGKKVKSLPSNPRSDRQFNRYLVQVSCLQALHHIAIIHSFYTATLQIQ